MSAHFYARTNSFFQGSLNDIKQDFTAIAGRVSQLERRKKNASSPGSAAAKAGKKMSQSYSWLVGNLDSLHLVMAAWPH